MLGAARQLGVEATFHQPSRVMAAVAAFLKRRGTAGLARGALRNNTEGARSAPRGPSPCQECHCAGWRRRGRRQRRCALSARWGAAALPTLPGQAAWRSPRCGQATRQALRGAVLAPRASAGAAGRDDSDELQRPRGGDGHNAAGRTQAPPRGAAQCRAAGVPDGPSAGRGAARLLLLAPWLPRGASHVARP